MIRRIFFIGLCCFFNLVVYAQVGINTTSPNAQLDVVASSTSAPTATDGFLPPRISVLPTGMTSDQTGMMVYLTTDIGDSTPAGIYIYNGTAFQNIFTVALEEKSIVNGHISTTFSAGSAGIDSYVQIPFDVETFDLKNEFNTTTHTFTAKVSGYYRIYAQGSQIDFFDPGVHGIAIYKNGSPIAVSRSKHPGAVGVDTIYDGYTRSVATITQLNAGDTITFRFNQDRASLTPDSDKTYFTIEQIQ